MADGDQGEAIAAAMRVLIEYGEIMQAERLIPVASAAGANIYGPRHSLPLGSDDPARLFGEYSLNSDRPVNAPPVRVPSCQVIGPIDRELATEVQGLSPEAIARVDASQDYLDGLGVSLLNTCTPYQAGFLPKFGDHCAWMESSAVVFINSVIGARTNTEGRESAAASMLTGLTPEAGLHLTANRFADIQIDVAIEVASTFEWNAFGYWMGAAINDRIPAISGITSRPDFVQLKQFGAAAASSGDVELFHIPGITAECESISQVLRPNADRITFGEDEMRWAIDRLNATRTGDEIDFVMIGCPHANYDQIVEVAGLLDGRSVNPAVSMWIFTPDKLRRRARDEGVLDVIERAGARLLADTCPAISQFLPKGTRRFVTDSAKQAHYLPAIMGIEGAFASTSECVTAAIEGRLA